MTWSSQHSASSHLGRPPWCGCAWTAPRPAERRDRPASSRSPDPRTCTRTTCPRSEGKGDSSRSTEGTRDQKSTKSPWHLTVGIVLTTRIVPGKQGCLPTRTASSVVRVVGKLAVSFMTLPSRKNTKCCLVYPDLQKQWSTNTRTYTNVITTSRRSTEPETDLNAKGFNNTGANV